MALARNYTSLAADFAVSFERLGLPIPKLIRAKHQGGRDMYTRHLLIRRKRQMAKSVVYLYRLRRFLSRLFYVDIPQIFEEG
jgi:hypothetical protein